MGVYWLSIFDKTIRINCDDTRMNDLVLAVYGSMQVPENQVTLPPDIDYVLSRTDREGEEYCIQRRGEKAIYSNDDGLFIYLLEKDMTIELEVQRSDLYFLHAAALEYLGRIHLLVAESGGGKSTTAWALMHHGFNYSSDELAPVQLDTMQILIYPHAVCQKTEAPEPYNLPSNTILTSRTLHVPVESLPCNLVKESLEIASIFFVKYNPETKIPSTKSVSRAEATARVYANGLNQLAHPADGLDAAEAIASHCLCYELNTAKLEDTCELVKTLLDNEFNH